MISNASKFHNRVREIFVADPFFKMMKCYQEVNVADLVEGYPYRNHHFDWFIEELQMVVELHGAQHYKATNYGSMGYDETHRAFRDMQNRDSQKKTAALEAGYDYTEISYKEYKKLDAKHLQSLIFYGT